ncbi:MAG: SCO family protein [Chitinophagaceae bacterium]
MNKKALLAICIALIIPLICYYILKYESNEAVVLPRKYLLDSLVTTVKDGRQTTDSIWHTTANIRLVNQLGDTVNLYDIKGKAIVIDFFFTSCASICPTLTKNMVKLQQSFLKGGDAMDPVDSSIVQFVSFTVDPERDSVARLKAYADRFGVNHDNWWMLTGPKDSIYNFAFEQLKVDKFSTEPIDPNFVHTSRFVLLDKNYVVRGYYDGLDSSSLNQLAKDIGILMLENDPNHPDPLPFDPISLAVFLLITIVIVVVVTAFIFKRKM